VLESVGPGFVQLADLLQWIIGSARWRVIHTALDSYENMAGLWIVAEDVCRRKTIAVTLNMDVEKK